MNKEQILGFNVCTSNLKQLIENIFEDYQNDEQIFIVNVNPEIVVKNYKNEILKQEFNKQKYQIPDGTGIVWASKKQKGSIKERIAGIDFMLKICEKSQEYSSKIFLYGGNDGIAEKAKEEIEKKYPEINVVGTCNGYEEENNVFKKIKNSDADIIFVGTGSPKQEEFIIKYKDELKGIKILMPIGGSLDVISKTKERAPNWVIKFNLEWLFRLIKEPKRIFRQIKLIKFIFLVSTQKKSWK